MRQQCSTEKYTINLAQDNQRQNEQNISIQKEEISANITNHCIKSTKSSVEFKENIVRDEKKYCKRTEEASDRLAASVQTILSYSAPDSSSCVRNDL